jgi:predicted glycogen debranching enzyme
MKFSKDTLNDYASSSQLEWLETNGQGGYASSSLSGANTRRYHGLLVASLNPPVERTVLLSKLDETLLIEEEDQTEPIQLALGANQFPGTLYPRGFEYLTSFEHSPFPVFTYQAEGITLRKTIAAVSGENTTLIIYEVEEATSPFTLSLLPLYSGRDFHKLSHVNDAIGRQYLFDDHIFRTLNDQDGTELFISVPGATFREAPSWYYNFEYAVEQRRGMDFREDLFTHGSFEISLKRGDRVGIIVSTLSPEGRNALELLEEERSRRAQLVRDSSWNEDVRRLVLAADQFVVKRDQLKTVIAGYHWFADWGRDAMISLPGLCLVTGRYSEAQHILQQFADNVSEGMLPNRFPDVGEKPEYNTIDATLWFFHAVYRYFHYTQDKAFIDQIFPILEKIIECHVDGTRYGIKVDPIDGLLHGGQPGVQLTWMDAKVGDWVVTPRVGKPVEINALWYTALRAMEYFSDFLGQQPKTPKYREAADRVHKNFNKQFWNKKDGYLFDVIDDGKPNADIRPNQLYAISLPFPLLSRDRARKVLSVVSQELLTTRGIRSLNSGNSAYRGRYEGGVMQRDGAYHQGTVWSFLLGPYVDALVNVKGQSGKKEASKIIQQFLGHLNEGCIGSVSEIFDADMPHEPRGCIAQAWGVAEILRVIMEHTLVKRSVDQESTTAILH